MDVELLEMNPEQVDWHRVLQPGSVLIATGPYPQDHVQSLIEQAAKVSVVQPNDLVEALVQGNGDVAAALLPG